MGANFRNDNAAGFLFFHRLDAGGLSVIRQVTFFEAEVFMVNGFLASLGRHR